MTVPSVEAGTKYHMVVRLRPGRRAGAGPPRDPPRQCRDAAAKRSFRIEARKSGCIFPAPGRGRADLRGAVFEPRGRAGGRKNGPPGGGAGPGGRRQGSGLRNAAGRSIFNGDRGPRKDRLDPEVRGHSFSKGRLTKIELAGFVARIGPMPNRGMFCRMK